MPLCSLLPSASQSSPCTHHSRSEAQLVLTLLNWEKTSAKVQLCIVRAKPWEAQNYMSMGCVSGEVRAKMGNGKWEQHCLLSAGRQQDGSLLAGLLAVMCSRVLLLE